MLILFLNFVLTEKTESNRFFVQQNNVANACCWSFDDGNIDWNPTE